MKKIVLKSLLLALGFSSSLALAEQPLKIGFIYVGPVGDYGWSYQHDQGRQAIEKTFGDKVKTTYVESVKDGPDAERVLNQLANDGNTLIFSTSFGFMNPTVKSAKKFKNVKFEHATGYKREPNLATYSSRFYEGRYISGILAGGMTKSNVIGYVASYPIPEVVRGINAAMLGAKSVNPDAQIKVVWTNSWYDPAKETEAAKSLFATGADVIMQHTDSPAVAQAGEENGAWVIGWTTDMSKFAPNKQLTAIVDDWSHYYENRVQAVLDGKWESKDTWGGFAQKMLEMTPFNPVVPEAIREKATAAKQAITENKLHPFTGPIKNQAGQEVLADGKTLDDEALLKMDYFVEGVVGDLPKK